MKFCTSLLLFALSISLGTSSNKHLSRTHSFKENADSPRFSFSIGNTSYEATKFQVSWQMSKYYCKRIGMELVSIETEEESEAIYAAMEGFRGDFWIGLNDGFETNDFYWESTGLLAGPYFNWRANEPGADDCVTWDSSDGKWEGQPCNYVYKAICESIPCKNNECK